MSRLGALLRRLRAGLAARLAPAPPGFPARLAAAIAHEEGVLLRVAALERSLGASGRRSSRNPNQE